MKKKKRKLRPNLLTLILPFHKIFSKHHPLKLIKKETKNVETEISKYPNHQNTETVTEEKYFIILKDKILSEICFPKTTVQSRFRSNSVPSRSNDQVKRSSKNVATKYVNPKEAQWDAIDPDIDVAVASALYLTRDIAGFFCATANGLGRTDLIEDMIEEMTEHIEAIT